MCTPASFVLTINDIYWSANTDSHEQIIEEHKLNQDVVRVEITPPNDDFSKPLDEWVFETDQDILPDWYDAMLAEKRARSALVEWANKKLVFTGKRKIESGELYAFGNADVWAYQTSVVIARETAVVRSNGYCRVAAYDNTNIKAYGSSNVTARYMSRVLAFDNAIIFATDNASVTCCGDSLVNAYGNSIINCDGGTVRRFSPGVVDNLLSRGSVLIDKTIGKTICTVKE